MTPPALTPARLPPVRGEQRADYDVRHHVYAADHPSFDALSSCRDGGPTAVAVSDRCVCASFVDRAFSSRGVVAADDGRQGLLTV